MAAEEVRTTQAEWSATEQLGFDRGALCKISAVSFSTAPFGTGDVPTSLFAASKLVSPSKTIAWRRD